MPHVVVEVMMDNRYHSNIHSSEQSLDSWLPTRVGVRRASETGNRGPGETSSISQVSYWLHSTT